MPRTFDYSFTGLGVDPVAGPSVTLLRSEIEAAGVREVLQTPGAALGTWSVLDALLEPAGPGAPFRFRQPLGQAREVKVALSGLFGRFVARAYLERYFRLSFFAHLGRRTIRLNGTRRVVVRRRAGYPRGDLPDWIACDAALSTVAVAEAKGCHDSGGPDKALARAWTQAARVSVVAGGRLIGVKRIAVATRWAATIGPLDTPMMAVEDPDEEGEATLEDRDLAYVGVARLHAANLLAPIGHGELAAALREASQLGFRRGAAVAEERAARVFEDSPGFAARGGVASSLPEDDLIGGFVTRAGPLQEPLVSADQATLARLALRPLFVGIERSVLQALISGDAEKIRSSAKRERYSSELASDDGAGTWVVELGRDATVT